MALRDRPGRRGPRSTAPHGAPRGAALSALGLALAACAQAPPVRTVPFEEELLNAVRAAVDYEGLASHRAGYELVGDRIEASGRVSFRVAFDLMGRSCLDVGGEMPCSRGFDGLRTWTQDASGVVREVGLGEAERIRCEAWLRTGLWLDPYQPRFLARVDRRSSDADVVALRLERQGSPLRATVLVDRATSLPRSYAIDGSGWTVELGEWGRIGAGRTPFRLMHLRDDGARVVEEVRLATPTDSPSLRPPRPLPDDTTFVAGAPSAAAARLGADGRLYAEARLDGRRSAWMLVDTGFGATALDRSVADELGWPTTGELLLDGVGGEGAARWRRSGTVTVGPLEVAGLYVAELDGIAPSTAAGFTVEGVLGADVLARATLELDPLRGSLALFDPRGPLRAEPAGGLPWQRVVLDGTAPCVEARIGAAGEVWLRLDTGSDDTLSVAPWAVDELGLAPSTVDLEPVHLVGPFGALRGWRGELGALRIGGAVLERLPVTFLDPLGPGAGRLDDAWIAGNLGLSALRGYRLHIDVSRSRVALVPAP